MANKVVETSVNESATVEAPVEEPVEATEPVQDDAYMVKDT